MLKSPSSDLVTDNKTPVAAATSMERRDEDEDKDEEEPYPSDTAEDDTSYGGPSADKRIIQGMHRKIQKKDK